MNYNEYKSREICDDHEIFHCKECEYGYHEGDGDFEDFCELCDELLNDCECEEEE